MINCQKVYEEFYATKHQGRNLTWQPMLGHCLVKARLPKGDKELHVSVLQTAVLLCWDGPVDGAAEEARQQLSVQEIRERTGIVDDGELMRTLQSLSCGKQKVLLRHTAAVIPYP